MSDIPANVQRGVELLDERLPGWRKRVNADDLSLSSDCDCILGQLFGSYDAGVELLDVAPRWYGFYAAGRQTWMRLTEAWRKVLAS